MWMRCGGVQNLLGDLEADIRHVMEPNTATSLKVRRGITDARCSPSQDDIGRARTPFAHEPAALSP
jgi:hypothetical protein